MRRVPPAHPATARGLIRDGDGRWLIVRPVDDHRWHLPGGLVEQDESPADACRRELREELGVDFIPGPLHALGWNPPRRPGRNARFSFVFDMGTHDADRLSPRIRLQATELDAWQWSPPDDALNLLHPDMAARLTVARSDPPSAVYTEQRCPLPAWSRPTAAPIGQRGTQTDQPAQHGCYLPLLALRGRARPL